MSSSRAQWARGLRQNIDELVPRKTRVVILGCLAGGVAGVQSNSNGKRGNGTLALCYSHGVYEQENGYSESECPSPLSANGPGRRTKKVSRRGSQSTVVMQLGWAPRTDIFILVSFL